MVILSEKSSPVQSVGKPMKSKFGHDIDWLTGKTFDILFCSKSTKKPFEHGIQIKIVFLGLASDVIKNILLFWQRKQYVFRRYVWTDSNALVQTTEQLKLQELQSKSKYLVNIFAVLETGTVTPKRVLLQVTASGSPMKSEIGHDIEEFTATLSCLIYRQERSTSLPLNVNQRIGWRWNDNPKLEIIFRREQPRWPVRTPCRYRSRTRLTGNFFSPSPLFFIRETDICWTCPIGKNV